MLRFHLVEEDVMKLLSYVQTLLSVSKPSTKKQPLKKGEQETFFPLKRGEFYSRIDIKRSHSPIIHELLEAETINLNQMVSVSGENEVKIEIPNIEIRSTPFDGVYSIQKKIPSIENREIFILDVTAMTQKHSVMRDLLFLQITPSNLKKMPSLRVSRPTLHIVVLGNAIELSFSYSIEIRELFDAKHPYPPFYGQKIPEMLLECGFSNLPTYYQSGYEFLNEWNGVGRRFEDYSSYFDNSLDSDVSSRIRQVFSQIRSPSSQVFYNILTEYASKLRLPVSYQNSFLIPGLATELFNFQKRTILWCLDKENVDYDFNLGAARSRPFFDRGLFERNGSYDYNYLSKIIDKVVFGWCRMLKGNTKILPVTDPRNGFYENLPLEDVFWVNKYTGCFISSTNLLKILDTSYSTPLSCDSISVPAPVYAQNMLLEEMGLGKTVELSALLLANPRSDFRPVQYDNSTASSISDTNYVFDKVLGRQVLKSKTTLIVCPDAILSQWEDEMRKIAPSLRVLVYKGFGAFHKSSKPPKRRFLIRIKYDKDKMIEKVTDGDCLINFSSFEKGTKKLSVYSAVENLNDANPTDRFELVSINGGVYHTPVIYGTDSMRAKLHQSVTPLDVNFYQPSNVEVDPAHKKIAFTLSQYDVILTTYNVVTSELYYAQYNPQRRPKREASKHALINQSDTLLLSTNRVDYSSPLVLLQFWRVVLDEVQMVSGTFLNAAKTCKIFLRCHSWAVSGTPIKKNVEDLMSYLSFLRVEPFNPEAAVESRGVNVLSKGSVLFTDTFLKPNLKEEGCIDFTKLVIGLGIRHDKTIVGDDIKLPKQHRILLLSLFSPVEQDSYVSVFREFLARADLNEKGEPVKEDWQPDTRLMREYLTRLRKMCCSVNFGESIANDKSKTFLMEDIFQKLLEDVQGSIAENERDLANSRLQEAELRELEGNPFEFRRILRESIAFVQDKVKAMVEEVNEKKGRNVNKEKKDKDGAQTRLKGWIEIFHKYLFFMGNAEFQIGEKLAGELKGLGVSEEELQGLSDVKEIEFKVENVGEQWVLSLMENFEVDDSNTLIKAESTKEKLAKRYAFAKESETKFYKKAEYIRERFLKEFSFAAESSIIELLKDSFTLEVPLADFSRFSTAELKNVRSGEVRLWVYRLTRVVDELNSQAKLINLWIQRLIALLSLPLLPDNEGLEYSDTIVNLEKASYLLSVIDLGLSFREALIQGSQLYSFNKNNPKGVLEALLDQNGPGEIDSMSKKQKKKNEENPSGLDDEGLKELEHFKGELKKELLESVPEFCKLDNEELNLKLVAEFFVRAAKTCQDWESYKKWEKRTQSRDFVLNSDLKKEPPMPYLAPERSAISIYGPLVKDLRAQAMKGFTDIKTKGVTKLNGVFNARAAYYAQLQVISDSVVSTDFNRYYSVARSSLHLSDEENQVQSFLKENLQNFCNFVKSYIIERKVEKARNKLAHLKGRLLYLNSLGQELNGEGSEDAKTCIICQSEIVYGVMLQCGHRFCRGCLLSWFKTSRTCPLCKAQVMKNTLYDFVQSNRSLEVGRIEGKDEDQTNEIRPNVSNQTSTKNTPFYETVSDDTSKAIALVKLSQRFGAKTDSIVRLVLWLKKKTLLEVGEKVQIVVFLQWESYLGVVSEALKANGVRFEGVSNKNRRIDGPTIIRFKSNRDITCFLLNPRQQAAGLTLVNATHVILCEPLVNTALELQAVNRIHRIGQTRETTVWMMGIKDTVEESIVNLSTKKRLAQVSKVHGGRGLSDHYLKFMDQKGDAQMMVESMDMAGSMAGVMSNGNELVPADELWESFFS